MTLRSVRLTSLLLAAALTAFGATAKANYVISFNDLTLTNTTANPGFVNVGATLTGTLTAVEANFVIDAQTGGVWSSDLGVMVSNQNDINTAANGGVGLYQAGGFNTWGAAEYTSWGTGNSGNVGTPTVATRILANPIVFNGDASDPNVFLAHLWNSNSEGTWSGTITLVGLVPEPSSFLSLSLALMGLGLVRRR